MEHSVVNKYSDMAVGEVNRYKNEMLDYFHARQVDTNNANDHHSSSPSSGISNRQYYTTSVAQTTYELEGYASNDSDIAQKASTGNDNEELRISPTVRSSSGARTHLKSMSYEQDQSQTQTFLTEDPAAHPETPTNEIIAIPFYKAFQIPSNLAYSIMFK
jgi:hypothetical protein